ncbi:MAG: hypothetical protein IJ358_03945 [Clostridia bacterium]|nr:hypothetical protein [Clostridia bacterium]
MQRNDFEFKYVAPTAEERKEIESIRNSYTIKDKSSNKLERLRSLDRKVKNIPTMVSLIVGVVGILIFGLGFSMVLEWDLFVWGIVVSIVGLIPIIMAYPLHLKVEKQLKNKHSKEILEISEELLNDENK